LTLTFSHTLAKVMTCERAENQGQRLVKGQSVQKMSGNGRTLPIALYSPQTRWVMILQQTASRTSYHACSRLWLS